MKANRSISMTLLVLMLVSSWSVPADAGLLDRLCRIGRARTTVCRPVQRQRLLGKLFRYEEKRQYWAPPPSGGVAGCPTMKILEVKSNDQCVFSVFQMSNCWTNQSWITAMPCDTHQSNCQNNSCRYGVGWVWIYPTTIEADPPLQVSPTISSNWLSVNRGYSGSGVSSAVSGVGEIQNQTATSSGGYLLVSTQVVKLKIGNEDRVFALYNLTKEQESVGFGIELPNTTPASESTNFDIFTVQFGILKFQEKTPTNGERWLYVVYPKAQQ